jgi:hypothetical protein
MQQKSKDDPFYERFHQQLLESNTWPGVYVFKFIIPLLIRIKRRCWRCLKTKK